MAQYLNGNKMNILIIFKMFSLENVWDLFCLYCLEIIKNTNVVIKQIIFVCKKLRKIVFGKSCCMKMIERPQKKDKVLY